MPRGVDSLAAPFLHARRSNTTAQLAALSETPIRMAAMGRALTGLTTKVEAYDSRAGSSIRTTSHSSWPALRIPIFKYLSLTTHSMDQPSGKFNW